LRLDQLSGSRPHTPEYFRHGTVSLFAALDVKKGEVLGQCYRQHRAKESLAFLKEIETHVAAEVAAGKELHLVLDNYGTHKSAAVSRWLVRRAHWHLQFTPPTLRGSIKWNASLPRLPPKLSAEAIS
jgi:hypothetical protein